jgi:hypothetical protein
MQWFHIDLFYFLFITLFTPQICGIQLVVAVLSLQLPYGLGRGECQAVRPPKHDPTKSHCFLTQCPLKPEASRTNVSEETLYPGNRCQHALHPASHRSR